MYDEPVLVGQNGASKTDMSNRNFDYRQKSQIFYEKHCLDKNNPNKLTKVFKDEMDNIKHICFTKIDDAKSGLDE